MLQWILSSSVLIVIVIVLRYVMRGKISPRLQYALWLPVLIRLLIPFSIGDTVLSIMNVADRAPLLQEAELLDGIDYIEYSPSGSIVGYYSYDYMWDYPIILAENVSEEDYERINSVLDAKGILNAIWKTGVWLVFALFVFSNLRFRNSLALNRRPIEAPNSRLPVYRTDIAQSPFLFGLLRPAVYVTPETESDPTILRHSVAHEISHFQQGDHVWLLLRAVCLALHWYNPLVWWAALISRRDSELACDDLTIKHLGEDERASYGRTLINMTCNKSKSFLLAATTMTDGKSSIKERIMMIAQKPKMAALTLGAVILISAIAVGCTFTGTNDNVELTPEAGTSTPSFNSDETDGHEDGDTFLPKVTLGQNIGQLPEAITAWATEYTGTMVEYYMELGAIDGYVVTGAEVTGITLVPTGTAALDFSLNLYRLEYRIQVDKPENVVLAGGMGLDGDSITEWSSVGQPYLLLFFSSNNGQSISERICITNTENIEVEYGTPQMLEKYGDMYTAAVMELYAIYQSTYSLNGVSIVLEPGFTLRENAYPCFENSDGVLVGLDIVDKDELHDFSPADQPLELESLPINEYDCFYNSYTFEGEYHYNVFREFDVGIVVVQFACPEYDAAQYADIFPKWASTAVLTD